MKTRWDTMTEIFKGEKDVVRDENTIKKTLKLEINVERSKNNPIIVSDIWLTIDGRYYKIVKSKAELLNLLGKSISKR